MTKPYEIENSVGWQGGWLGGRVADFNATSDREEQVPPEILDLGFFTPFLSRPIPARTKIKDPETRPNLRNSAFKFLILS